MLKPHVKLLNNLFNKFNNDIEYVVLRNYENLPEHYGNDVDILVENKQKNNALKIIEEIVIEHGYKIRTIVKRYCYNGIYINFGNNEELLIDIYTDLVKAWFPYANSKIILNGRCLYKNFYIPKYNHVAAIIIFKELLAYGYVREKYKWFINNTSKLNEHTFKESVIGFMSDLSIHKTWNCLINKKPILARPMPVKKNLINPISAIRWLFQRV